MPSSTSQPAARARGFTVIELMITVAVAVVLVALALPSFRGTIISNNVTQTTNALLHDLNIARSEAVRRGTLVAVISNSGSGNWSSGWYVQADGKFLGDGTFTALPVPASDPDVVLDKNAGVNTAGSYAVWGAVTAAGGTGITPTNNMVIFNAQGSMIPRATSFALSVCRPDHQPTKSKMLTIASSGMVTTQTDTSSSPANTCP